MSWINHEWAWLAIREEGIHLWLYPSVYRTTLIGGPVWEDMQ